MEQKEYVHTLKGDVVASSADAVRRELERLVRQGVTNLTVDMAEVTEVDSLGLAVFIGLHLALKERGGRLTIINTTSEMCELFQSMRLDQHFSVACKGE